MKTINANGLEFGYIDAGEGPLALCLHGFPDSAHSWRHLLTALADAGYHAVAPFMRGYAPTGVPADGAYQAGALVADANALHEAFGGDGDAVLIGHDWGAIATYGALAHAPQRWRRAVTMSVAPLGATLEGLFGYEQLKKSFYMFVFQTPVAEQVTTPEFIAGLWRDWSPAYTGDEGVANANACLATPENLAAAIGYYRAVFDPSLNVPRYAAEQESLQRVGDHPILYLHGEADGCIDADIVPDPARHLPSGSRHERIPGAGHFLHLERPDEVERLILDWL